MEASDWLLGCHSNQGWETAGRVEGSRALGAGSHVVWAEGASPEPEGTSPEVTSWQPEVTWFGAGNRGAGGKRDRGLRSDKERTGRDADMTSPLARVGNRGPQAGKTAGADQTKEDAML